MSDMKGITCCGDCFYYDWNKKRGKRGSSIEYDPKSYFFADCPLPSVEPERLKGRWIESLVIQGEAFALYEYTCPVCSIVSNRGSNFCPNCGADMRGESK